MKKALSLSLALLLLCGAAYSLHSAQAFASATVTISREEYDRLKQYEKLDEVKRYLEDYYFEKPDTQALMDGAIQGLMAGTKDVYTFYYPEESWANLWEQDEGKYSGIGVQMQANLETGAVTIIRVFAGTPAEAAGLRKGDVFYKVEELEVSSATMQDAVKIMRGEPGERVHVEVLRAGEALSFDIIKAEITVPRVASTMLDQQVGYIAIYDFAGGTYEQFNDALIAMHEQGMRSLVIDLRDNGGGWVQDGVRILDLFLDKAMVLYTEDRNQRQEKTYTTDGKDDIPLVLVINENSASTTEILSGAMQDLQRATLVGTKSFGKGIIQLVMSLSDQKTGIQFTSAQYFTPKGNKVHKEGITPDILVEMPEGMDVADLEMGDMSDPQLKAAWEEAVKLIPQGQQAAGQ